MYHHECLAIQWSGDVDGSTLQPEDFVTFNVCGMKYETLQKTLDRFPNTLLGNKIRRSPYFVNSRNAYFFNRCRQSFEAVLYYYQSGGILTRPTMIPMDVFEDEVLFYDLGEEVLYNLREEEGFIIDSVDTEDEFSDLNRTWRRTIWEIFEHPDSSKAARIVSSWSMFVIGVSIVVFCLETLPYFKRIVHAEHIKAMKFMNGSIHDDSNLQRSEIQPWFSLELGCIIWFSIEYAARLISAPNRWNFLTSFLNTIDLFAIAPYFIILMINSDKNTTPLSVLRVVRLVRVFRIFKLSRYSISLKILGNTLKVSVRELGMLMFFLCLGVVVFSSALYYAEKGSSDNFPSIPEAFWYSVVTMTTVGYGDKKPTTALGKLVGSLCAITGVLTLALPVPVIVSNFAFFYKRDCLVKKNQRKKTEEEVINIGISSVT